MPYVNSDGSVQESRSWFRFSIITDLFWGIANALALFVKTLVDPKAAIPKGKYVSSGSNSAGQKQLPSGARPGKANIHTVPKPSCSKGS